MNKTYWLCLLSLCSLLGFQNVNAASRQDGFVLSHWGEYTTNQALDAIDSAAKTGAKHISVLVHLCSRSRNDNEVVWCDGADQWPSQEQESITFADSIQANRLSEILPTIRNHGMSIGVIPIVHAKGTENRQFINPSVPAKWFSNYSKKMSDLADYSQKIGATELIAGSELTMLFLNDQGWRQVIGEIRKKFSGHVTISAFFLHYPFITFWDALDSIGISAYFPLALIKGHRSVALLERRWKLHKAALYTFSALKQKPLTFVEVGYPTTDVAAQRPWDYQWRKRKLDYELQRRCFEAFTNVWSGAKRLRRFSIWGLSGQIHENFEKDFHPIGKPAEMPISRAFSIRQRL